MVERILEEKNASTAAAKELLSLRVNAGSASVASNSGNNNNASGSGDSGVGGSNVSCSNTDNSCSQSQSGECWISTFFYHSFLSSLSFALHIPLSLCRYVAGFRQLYSLLVTLCKLCALKLCSCLRQKARIKETLKERGSEKGGEREGSSSLYPCGLLARLCVFSVLPIRFAFLLRLSVSIEHTQCVFRKCSRIIPLASVCAW